MSVIHDITDPGDLGRKLAHGIGKGVDDVYNDAKKDLTDRRTAPQIRRARRKKKAAKKKAKKKAKKQSTSSKSSPNGKNGPSDSERASWENGTGLPFDGSMAAQMVHAIMFRFILGDSDLNNNYGKVDLMYHYKFFVPKSITGSKSSIQYLGVRNLLDIDIPDDAVSWIKDNNNRYQIFNPDEAMNKDPSRFMKFQGSIDELVQAISNAPFNEVYWTHEEEYDHLDTVGLAQRSALENLPADPYHPSTYNNVLAKDYFNRIPHATLHFRQTPFRERDWIQLPVHNIHESNIIDFQLDRNDVEQKSVFNITNDGEGLDDVTNLPPVTDDREELMRRYGYRYMDVTSDYFENTNSLTGLDAQDLTRAIGNQDDSTIPADAWITYPSVEIFNDYFGPDSASQIAKDKDPHLTEMIPMSSQEGGDDLYYHTLGILQSHLDRFKEDRIEYEVAQMFISYINALGGAKSPTDLPSGDPLGVPVEYVQDAATNAYNRWVKDLAGLNQADQATNTDISNSVGQDEQKMVTYTNNVYRTYDADTGQFEPDSNSINNSTDPVITYQKAGELIMQYIVGTTEGDNKDSIHKLLGSQAVKALNPWLAQVENAGSTNGETGKNKKKGQNPSDHSNLASAISAGDKSEVTRAVQTIISQEENNS